jgi:hypothetical protein
MKDTTMVLESARRKLADLAPLAKRLNAASDEFTKELKAIEADLAKLALGLEVTLAEPLHESDIMNGENDDDPPVWVDSHLGYVRHGDGWGLMVRVFRKHNDDEAFGGVVSVLVRETPLVSASRELRIAAAEQINPLIDRIKTEAANKLAALEKQMDIKTT